MNTQTTTKTEWDNQTHGLWLIYDDLSRGEQAEVRRGLPSEPFWRMLACIGKEEAPLDDLPTWRLLIQCVAIAGYSKKPAFGVALMRANYSEARLKRLLEADADQLPGILRRTAKQLKSAKQTGNWNTIRRLLFDYEGEAERVRMQIAQEYYTYTDDTSNETSDSDE